MNIEQKTKEIVMSRTYTLDAHDVEVIDAFCNTIRSNNGEPAFRAAKSLANMLQTYTGDNTTDTKKPTLYNLYITGVKQGAEIVFMKGRSFVGITAEQKEIIRDIITPWCTYRTELAENEA